MNSSGATTVAISGCSPRSRVRSSSPLGATPAKSRSRGAILALATASCPGAPQWRKRIHTAAAGRVAGRCATAAGTQREQLRTVDHRARALATETYRSQRDTLSELLTLDLEWQLAESLLQKADKMSMGASIELRTPRSPPCRGGRGPDSLRPQASTGRPRETGLAAMPRTEAERTADAAEAGLPRAAHAMVFRTVAGADGSRSFRE